MTTLSIGGRPVGSDQPCFIIAEAGVNHTGDPKLAHALVDVAARAGVDAVKFQTFTAERLVSQAALKAEYQLIHTDTHESQFEMLKRLELSLPVHKALAAHCAELGVLFMSTPFDEQSADDLEALGVCAYKIPSGEITNLPYLTHLARKGKPLIVSTGMATLREVETATSVMAAAGNRDVILLHCVTNYPADPRDCNLRAMQTMAAALGLPVGWSDHTAGMEISVAAVALGACVIEKHFTLDRALPGPDHQASLTPEELRAMVDCIRRAESAMGDGVKRPKESEFANIAISRKSVHWRQTLEAGRVVSLEALIALRPAHGVPPARLPSLAGRILARAVRAGDMVSEDDFELTP